MEITDEMIKGMHHAIPRPAEATRSEYADRFAALMVGSKTAATSQKRTTPMETTDPRNEMYASLSTYDQDDEEFYRQLAEKKRQEAKDAEASKAGSGQA